MHLFLLGILADEAFRFLWRRFFTRHPERLAQLRALRARGRSIVAGGLDPRDLIGALAEEQTDPINTRGMAYMAWEGPSEIDGGQPPDNYGRSAVPFSDVAGSAIPFSDVAGAGFLDALKAKALERAQNEAAAAIVDNFASEMMSGCLGAVDQEAREALRRHLEWHKRREAAVAGCMGGWGIPGLSTLAKVKSFADRLSPSAYLKRKLMAKARGGGGGGGRAPGPQPDGAPPEEAAPPEGGDDAPADATEGALMSYNLQSPTNQLVHTLHTVSGTAAAELCRRAQSGDPQAIAAVRMMRHRRGGGAGVPRGRWGAPPAASSGGWGLPSFLRRGASAASSVASNPAGKLLISAVPGGASAQAAHAIASKALKNGTLKPAHLKAAGDLTKRGRAGDQGALMKIAQIKKKAGRGDAAAEVALDRIKLAHCIQTGKACGPSGRGGTVRAHYNAGADHMLRHQPRRHAH